MLRLAAAFALPLLLLAAPAPACTGDCDGDGTVSIDELVGGVGIALGSAAVDSCPAFDVDGDGTVAINELIAAVDRALSGCPSATATPSPTPTATPGDGDLAIADVVARDATGGVLRLGERVTVEGIITVDAGLFANNRLKVFAQADGAAVMIYHQTSSGVAALQAGDRVRATGVVRQEDPSSGDNRNVGTVLVDLTDGQVTVLGQGNPLPEPVAVSAAALTADGVPYTGLVVRIAGLRRVSGDWPQLGDRTTEVVVGDGAGTTLSMRFQRATITADLADALAAIGDAPFTATGIVVQDDPTPGDGLLDNFELWSRGAEDIGTAD